MNKSSTFLENYFYHIYNRGNNKELIFFNNENYTYFFKKFDTYLTNYLDVYAYCLLPNHFHLLVKVKENDAIADSDGIDNLNHMISEQFRRFFLGYSQAINKQQRRTGSLFQKHYKRKMIETENYLSKIIYYIHLNPVHHNVYQDYKNYRWSSYKNILGSKLTKLKRNEIYNLFESKKNFIEMHEIQLENLIEIENYLFN